jgi:hypothetical protein
VVREQETNSWKSIIRSWLWHFNWKYQKMQDWTGGYVNNETLISNYNAISGSWAGKKHKQTLCYT